LLLLITDRKLYVPDRTASITLDDRVTLNGGARGAQFGGGVSLRILVAFDLERQNSVC